MKRATKAVRKIIIAAIGFPLLIFGLILIPLPGPGVLVCLAALVVLSTEFEWAQKYADKCRAILKKVIDKAKEQAMEKHPDSDKPDDSVKSLPKAKHAKN